jgi:hypothetical protein
MSRRNLRCACRDRSRALDAFDAEISAGRSPEAKASTEARRAADGEELSRMDLEVRERTGTTGLPAAERKRRLFQVALLARSLANLAGRAERLSRKSPAERVALHPESVAWLTGKVNEVSDDLSRVLSGERLFASRPMPRAGP